VLACAGESSAAKVIKRSDREDASFSLGLNVAAPLAYGWLATAYETSLVAVPLESSFRINDYFGISASVHYAYLTSDRLKFEVQDDYGDVRFLADDAHQILIGFGPRISFSGNGLEGWYAFLEFAAAYSHASGEGYRWPTSVYAPPRSPEGSEEVIEVSRLDLGFRPEVGYGFSFGSPGFYMSLGIGLRVLFTVYCDPAPSEDHETSAFDFLLLYTPIINLTLGFDI